MTTSRAARFLLLAMLCALAWVTPAVSQSGSDPELSAIEDLIAAGRLPEARQAVERFEAAHPDSERIPGLWLTLARGETALFGRRARLRDVTHRFPGTSAAADALYEMIELAYLAGDVNETLRLARTFEQTLATDSRIPDVVRMQVRLLMSRGQQTAAQERLSTVRALSGSTEDEALDLVLRAEILLAENKPEQARAYLERAVASGAGDVAGAAFRLGEAAYLGGQRDLAARAFAMVIERYPDSLYADKSRERLERIGPSPAAP